jgi:hypothetical protein
MTNIYFELDPVLPFINVEATKGYFYLQYPSGWSYWAIQDAKGTNLKDGNYTFSQEVLAQWTTSDQVLIDDILAAAPWIVVDNVPVPPEPEPVIEPVIEEIIEEIIEETLPISE